MDNYGNFTKDKNVIEMDKMAGGTYTLIKDGDPKSAIVLNLLGFLEFIKTHPVTKKKITYEEYGAYRKQDIFDFDEKELFFYLSDGYRILMETETAGRKHYYDPCMEDSILYSCFPTEYANGFGPDGDLLAAVFGKLSQDMVSGSNGYILSDAGIQETANGVKFDLDGLSWECAA